VSTRLAVHVSNNGNTVIGTVCALHDTPWWVTYATFWLT